MSVACHKAGDQLMGTEGLAAAVKRGAPLVEITVRFVEGIDYAAATEAMNRLSDQLHLLGMPWYGDDTFRTGSATKEALESLFGWILIRVPLERFDEATATWGHWPDFYRWEESQPVQRYPQEVAGLIARLGCSQPGAEDDGQWYE